MKPFSQLSISKEMLANLDQIGYEVMTPIQEKSIPPILEGKDILAQAKTGSGKTAAFGIGMLENLDFKLYRVQSLILCPTRELAEQVTGELRKIGRFRHNIKMLKITGGIPMFKQEHSLSHQAHIVVGTPGRVLKLLKRGSLNPKHLKMLILDEADRMLDMGFIDELKEIITYLPQGTQNLCYSATFPDDIKKLSRQIMSNHTEITVDTKHKEAVINQKFYLSKYKSKTKTLINILSKFKPENVIIFCNTKNECNNILDELSRLGLHVIALHGDLEQKDRTEVLIRFSNGSCNILVATDVAARGLDISGLAAVINYDMPFETETYVHRIGRTGRAGNDGLSLSIISENELFRLEKLNEDLNCNFETEDIPVVDESIKIDEPDFITLSINGGRKNKISAGDILGALTSGGKIDGSSIGKIDRQDYLTFVAVKREIKDIAIKILETQRVKGKYFKALVND